MPFLKTLVLGMLIFSVFYLVLSPFPFGALTATSTSAQDFGLSETASQGGLKPSKAVSPSAFIGTLIGYALAFVGVIFFVLMIYGGFMWMTAHGKEEQVKKAKDLIEAAVIGVVIIFFAYTVTHFVLTNLISATYLSQQNQQ
jgi:hypothetical protein